MATPEHLSTSAAGDSFSSRISYSDAQATHAADAQLIPAALDQTPTHCHSSNSKVSDEYWNIFCEQVVWQLVILDEHDAILGCFEKVPS
jgi:hypothetical protein